MNRREAYGSVRATLRKGKSPDDAVVQALRGYLTPRQGRMLMQQALFNDPEQARSIAQWADWSKEDSTDCVYDWVERAAQEGRSEALRVLHELMDQEGVYETYNNITLCERWIENAVRAFIAGHDGVAQQLREQIAEIGAKNDSTLRDDYRSILTNQLREQISSLDDKTVVRILNEGVEVDRWMLKDLLEEGQYDRFEVLFDQTTLDGHGRRELLSSTLFIENPENKQHYQFLVENGHIDGTEADLSALFYRAVQGKNEDAVWRIASTSLNTPDDLEKPLTKLFSEGWVSSNSCREGTEFLLRYADEQDLLDDELITRALKQALNKARPGLVTKLSVLYDHGASLQDLARIDDDPTVRGLRRDRGLALDLILENDTLSDLIADRVVRQYNQPDQTEALKQLLKEGYHPRSPVDELSYAVRSHHRHNGQRRDLVRTWVDAFEEYDWSYEGIDAMLEELLSLVLVGNDDALSDDELELILTLPIDGPGYDHTYRMLVDNSNPDSSQVAQQLAEHGLLPSQKGLAEIENQINKSGDVDEQRILLAIKNTMSDRQRRAYDLQTAYFYDRVLVSGEIV